ncbi:AraC family transcriptional regulator [Streptomyces chartreusis]|uniref:AraC family transcriptional regulator n=1 Tax=Streptomyces chartreusis TaxID=1969 RepID=UPI0033C32FDE
MPYQQMQSLWTDLINTVCDPHIGLTVGARIRPAALHVVGHLVVNSATLGEAVAWAERYYALVSEAGRFHARRGRRHTQLVYEPLVDPEAILPQQMEAIIIGMVTTARWLSGPSWHPASVSFSHSHMNATAAYSEFVGAPVVFNAQVNAVTVDNRDLQQSRGLVNTELAAVHQEYAERSLRELLSPSGIPEQVSLWLATNPLEAARFVDVCESLHLSQSTLRRVLRSAGMSWKALLDAARRERALHLLAQTDLSLDRVASEVGFSEAAVLVRACNRWLGMTPGVYRRLQQPYATSASPGSAGERAE